MKKELKTIKCSICGRFIAFKDIKNKCLFNFTPDTEFSSEESWYDHKKCIKKYLGVKKVNYKGKSI